MSCGRSIDINIWIRPYSVTKARGNSRTRGFLNIVIMDYHISRQDVAANLHKNVVSVINCNSQKSEVKSR